MSTQVGGSGPSILVLIAVLVMVYIPKMQSLGIALKISLAAGMVINGTPVSPCRLGQNPLRELSPVRLG
jgi:hypothetical protein